MILELNQINTFYGETQVLYDISLAVGRGEVVSLLGPNGAGKTTTLRSILGLTPAREGAIFFDGQDITAKPTHEIARDGVGWVPDDRRIFPTLTVSRNLSIARKRTRFRAWDLNETFEIFTALEYLMERECENLSGGEMQMVAISRALLGSPGARGARAVSGARSCASLAACVQRRGGGGAHGAVPRKPGADAAPLP